MGGQIFFRVSDEYTGKTITLSAKHERRGGNSSDHDRNSTKSNTSIRESKGDRVSSRQKVKKKKKKLCTGPSWQVPFDFKSAVNLSLCT